MPGFYNESEQSDEDKRSDVYFCCDADRRLMYAGSHSVQFFHLTKMIAQLHFESGPYLHSSATFDGDTSTDFGSKRCNRKPP